MSISGVPENSSAIIFIGAAWMSQHARSAVPMCDASGSVLQTN